MRQTLCSQRLVYSQYQINLQVKNGHSVHKELLNGVFNSSALRALSIFLSKGHICGSRGTELDILPPQQPMLLLSIQ